MNYEEAVDFLDSRIRFGMRPGTERISALVEALGHPQHSYPVVHVSGTNGKFSVVCIVASILSELGLTVGTYTSPHLETVRERIGLAGSPIHEEKFAATLTYLEPYIAHVEEEIGDQLTFFELLTGMAFEAFFDLAVHAAVLEVGLGGEYDATNVADASVAIVTNVSVDHVRQFGRDLTKAAWEKSGIAKKDCFVVTGVEQDEIFDIVSSRAIERGAAGVARLGREIDVLERTVAVGGQMLTVRGLHGTYRDIFLSLYGSHQARNAALALAGCEAFAGEALDESAVGRALTNVRVPGRIEVVGRRPLVVCDGGHNPAAATTVREAVQESFAYDRLLVVVGMLSEKLIDEVLRVWAPITERFFVTAPRTERAATPERLAAALETLGISGDGIAVSGSVEHALGAALGEASQDDLILVFGSFYTVAEARTWLRSQGALAEA